MLRQTRRVHLRTRPNRNSHKSETIDLGSSAGRLLGEQTGNRGVAEQNNIRENEDPKIQKRADRTAVDRKLQYSRKETL